ncbi:MAG: hypothetical protein K0S74_623 [Chlamydiales bacterium]|jgi:hypothetical protein|nr:hypothetical protein [Chlamydiales bacterium]
MKYLKYFNSLAIGSLILSPLTYAQDEEHMTITSEFANYENNHLKLTGDVILDYPLGKLQAENAVIEKGGQELSLPFKQLVIEDKVHIELREGGEIDCDHAILDSISQKGLLTRKQSHERVNYNYGYLDAKGQSVKLRLQSQQMEIDLENLKPSKKHVGKMVIQRVCKIDAIDNVLASYNEEFTAFADRAIYTVPLRNQKLKPTNRAKVEGQIKLFPKKSEGICRIERLNSGSIDALKILIDPEQRVINFDKPEGFITTAEQGKDLMRDVCFQSNKLIWNELTNIFTFEQNVHIVDPILGAMECDGQVLIKDSPYTEKARKGIERIEALGYTLLNYTDPNNHIQQNLTCPGQVIINHKEFTTTLIGKNNGNGGGLIKENQVLLKDYLGEIFADKVRILYNVEGDKITPKKIILEGNVYILNNAPFDPSDSKEVFQVAYADRVEHTPMTGETHLFSQGDTRVLFYDQVRQMQVSAKELIMQRHQTMGKNAVQGIGQVRFNLSKEELGRLKKRFVINET